MLINVVYEGPLHKQTYLIKYRGRDDRRDPVRLLIDQTYQQLFRQQYGLEGKEEVKAFFGKKGRKKIYALKQTKKGIFFHPPHLYLASLVLDVCRDQNIYVGN